MNEPIKDKAPKPPGLLPKNVQSWVIIGIALLMVVIMWLTGGKKPQATGKSAAPTVLTPAPVEVNETKIADLQSRIQDLQKQQLAAQNALAQQTRLLGSLPQEQSQAQPNAGPSNVPPATAEDAIKAERRKREYLSLFASNLALTYRKSASSAGTAITENSPPEQSQAATQSPDASASRSERNQDCRASDPDSGSAEATACCAECARAANPPARIFAAGTVTGTTQCWSEQRPSCHC